MSPPALGGQAKPRNRHCTASSVRFAQMFSPAARWGRIQSPDCFLFAFAHLFFRAAANLARPSALIVLRFLAASLDGIRRLSGLYGL
jgi:hypothetical protein